MTIWKSIFFIAPVLAFGQINVGPALNNLNSRVTSLENRPAITVQDIVSMGFLTNELDKISLGILGIYTNDHSDVHSSLNIRISSIEGKATYPTRVYNSSSNMFLEFFGNHLSIYTNEVFCSRIATTNDLIPALDLITNNFLYFDGRITAIEQEMENVSYLKKINSYIGILSVYSNSIYTATSEPTGIVFQNPEAYPDKESKLTLHLYKGESPVTWFQNITWIYGAPPEWQETNKTYVIQFESIDGNSWKGWIEYVY